MAKKQNKFEKQEEQLQEVNNALTGVGKWIEKNSKKLSWCVTIIVLLILGFMFYQQRIVQPKHEAATEENGQNVWAYLYNQFEVAAQGDENIEGFAATADSYSNQEGKLAALFAGTCYFQLGQYEEAVNYLEKFSSDDLNFKAVAKQLLGDAYVELGDLEAAVNAFEAAAKTGNEVFAPMSLKKAGIAYLKLEDNEAARKAFTSIKENYPASVEARDIDKYIAIAE